MKRGGESDKGWGGMKLTWIWDAAVGDELIEQDAVRPDVGLDAELALERRFRRRPFDGELRR